MSAITLTLSGRGGKRQIEASLTPSSSTEELYKQVAAKTKLSVNRLRITTLDKKLIDNDAKKTVAEYSLKNNDALNWKDLGPQVSWRTVFLTEYAGPIFIHPLFYFYGHQILYKYLPFGWASKSEFAHSRMQTLSLYMVLAHYLKRELESVFVHRFSHATMPIFNIFKNSGHYWGLSGLLLAIPIYSPFYSASALRGSIQDKSEFLYLLFGLWLYSELSNLITHLNLRSLRPANDLKRRAIPRGYGFDLITCPNYFFEFLAWSAFTALTLNPASAIFLAVSTLQMMVWAKKKHRNYRKEFGDKYPKKRWMMIPGLW